MSGAQLEDVDHDALRAYMLRRVPSLVDKVPDEQLAVSLGLMARQGNRTAPTGLGVLAFGHLPQMLRPEWGVAALRISGADLSCPITEKLDIEGNIVALFEQTIAFVKKHTAEATSLDGAEGGEFAEVAVREAVINALVHRDYRLTARVSVRIFDDRLEVWSPGGPLGQFDFLQLLERGGISFPRNPTLASLARTLGLIDQVGRGLPLIRGAAEDLGAPAPRVEVSNGDFLVVMPSRLDVVSADPHAN